MVEDLLFGFVLSGDFESFIKTIDEPKLIDYDSRDSKNGNSLLHLSCRLGRLKFVQEIVKRGAILNITEGNNESITPLIFAARGGFLDIVKLLISATSDVLITIKQVLEGKEENGWCAFHYACYFNHLEMVKYLYDLYALYDISFSEVVCQNGPPPLFIAVSQNHEEMVQYLTLRNPRLAIITNKSNWSCLCKACDCGFVNIARMLLNLKEGVEDLLLFPNDNGWLPLGRACCNGHTDIFDLLVGEFGADITKGCVFTSLLNLAAGNGHLGIVLQLIKYGANIHEIDSTGVGALQSGCECVHSSRFEITNTLIQTGCSVSVVNNDGWNCLHSACHLGHEDVTELLLLQPGSASLINVANKDLDTPLHLACNHGSSNNVRRLLACDATIEAVNGSGYTPVQVAAQNGYLPTTIYYFFFYHLSKYILLIFNLFFVNYR